MPQVLFRTIRSRGNRPDWKAIAKEIEKTLDREIDGLLARESGWMIFNTHGLDEEGWGPIRATYLDRLLDRLTKIESVELLPAARAL